MKAEDFQDIWDLLKEQYPGMNFRSEQADADGFANYFERLGELDKEWVIKAAVYIKRHLRIKNEAYPPAIETIKNVVNTLIADEAREKEAEKREAEIAAAQESPDWIEYYANIKKYLGERAAQAMIKKNRSKGEAETILKALGLDKNILPDIHKKEKKLTTPKELQEARKRGQALLEREGVDISMHTKQRYQDGRA